MANLRTKKEHLRVRLQEKFSAKGKKVLVLGLGLQGGGVGVARFLATISMDVTVSDRASRTKMAPSITKLKGLNIKFIFGKNWDKHLEQYDFVVKNPGIPREYKPLKKAKKVTNDAEIFLTLAPKEKIIGITGTKGKTTTTHIIAHVLGNSLVVGTPGVSFFEYFFAKKEPKWIVAEFSSFDLEYPKESPHIAVFTSLFADHLNRYSSFASYAKTKMNLIKYQEKGDFAFLSPSKTITTFLPKTKSKLKRIPLSSKLTQSWKVPELSVSFAEQVALTLDIKHSTIKQRIKSFKPVEGRIEEIARKKGVTFVNDTTSTNPGSALYSFLQLKKYFSHIVVITGGQDKNFPSHEIKLYANNLKKADGVILLPGSFSDRLKKMISSPILVSSMNEAVKKAAGFGMKGGVVALIPSAASFNMFQNEFDRGRAYIQAVKKLK